MSAALATALVVDDERMVRMLVRRMLEPEVCAIVEADNGEAALRLIELGRPAIDVVLTDLVMPGIDGFDIVRVLARHRPELPVVCMSGFAAAAREELTVPFVPKPFSVEVLRGALEPAIARTRQLRQRPKEGRLQAGAERAASGPARRISGAAFSSALDLVAAALELRRQRAEPPAAS